MHEETIKALRKELKETRDASLSATRRGDFMAVAKFTAAAARINRELMEVEGLQETARTGANPRDGTRK